MSETTDDLARIRDRLRSWSDATDAATPLYADLAGAAADDDEVAGILLAAPETQRLPVLLLAAVHWLLLDGLDHPLRRHYPNLATLDDEPVAASDPAPTFLDLCHTHADVLRDLVATRTTQTNEVGRCALLLPPLVRVAEEVGPLALLDVGASGGLNLRLDHYGYRYAGHPPIAPDAAVQLHCDPHDLDVPGHVPAIAWRRGLDAAPIDVTDPAAARWLEACVWPDQVERFARLRTAIDVASAVPATVERGDAVDDLARLLQVAAVAGHPVVTNSWVLNYLSHEQRVDYLTVLDDVGATTDLSWVYAEAPRRIDGLPVPPGDEDVDVTVVTVVRWRDGVRHVDHLADAHPHGAWLRRR